MLLIKIKIRQVNLGNTDKPTEHKNNLQAFLSVSESD